MESARFRSPWSWPRHRPRERAANGRLPCARPTLPRPEACIHSANVESNGDLPRFGCHPRQPERERHGPGATQCQRAMLSHRLRRRLDDGSDVNNAAHLKSTQLQSFPCRCGNSSEASPCAVAGMRPCACPRQSWRCLPQNQECARPCRPRADPTTGSPPHLVGHIRGSSGGQLHLQRSGVSPLSSLPHKTGRVCHRSRRRLGHHPGTQGRVCRRAREAWQGWLNLCPRQNSSPVRGSE